MMPETKVLLWDFDGTLGYRPGMWRQALFDVLRENDPASPITEEDLRPLLRNGFPWHQPDIVHTHITTAEQWWTEIEAVLARAFIGVGIHSFQAARLAQLAHHKYIQQQSWYLFEDVLPTLSKLASEGWRHVILSNHVPELPSIVEGLGLVALIDTVISSALTGYEKPHPQAFINVLEQLHYPETVWMIGDNIEADILGAAAVNIPGILVRKEDKRANYTSLDLYGVSTFLP
ncbi:MAG TPA: HAD family hydrolase [Ktedonobacteraceae bacterium]|nr:HAD family hydrolase [Ktedonobacteraceae bacterium]